MGTRTDIRKWSKGVEPGSQKESRSSLLEIPSFSDYHGQHGGAMLECAKWHFMCTCSTSRYADMGQRSRNQKLMEAESHSMGCVLKFPGVKFS